MEMMGCCVFAGGGREVMLAMIAGSGLKDMERTNSQADGSEVKSH